MMDESMAPSNTPPCNAVYDGCNYYYLPWSKEKPCVCVESYWENIAFRLEPLNALLRIIDRAVRMAITLLSLGVFPVVSCGFSWLRGWRDLHVFCWWFSLAFQGDMHRFPGYLLCFLIEEEVVKGLLKKIW